MGTFFPESYADSRSRFIRDAEAIREKWATSRINSHPLKDFPNLSIDWLWAEPRVKQTLIIISTAEHGIEGYVGSAMLKIFMDEFAPRLNPQNTGLLLIHAINPWGMQNARKVNEHSVDINRNFTLNGVFDKSINPGFPKLKRLLAPEYPARPFFIENLQFTARTLQALATLGAASLTEAALLGQYVSPKAMYYGGERYEEETSIVTELFRDALVNYQTVIHLDQHSGYGPRYQMSITLVPLEPLSSAELSAKFNYPLVLRGDRKEFYEITGDMTAYLYDLRNTEFPGKDIFSCAFEFGTFGESTLARIRSLRAMIFESQLYWYGAQDVHTAEKIRQEFNELYFPAEDKWREKALADCRQAFKGVLSAYHLL